MTDILDKKGRPIRVGDLLRSYHFRDRRWGHQYLYHAVIERDGYLEAVPTQELATGKSAGGRYWLNQSNADSVGVEIIHGGGEFPENIFQERSILAEHQTKGV